MYRCMDGWMNKGTVCMEIISKYQKTFNTEIIAIAKK